jgi:hypothetical protein
VSELSGVVIYGKTREEAIAKVVEVLALMVPFFLILCKRLRREWSRLAYFLRNSPVIWFPYYDAAGMRVHCVSSQSCEPVR